MVGVPGLAGACLTCRRRKKGCDKQEPFCQQCISAGLVCEGYKQPRIWVNATGKQRATYTRAHNTVRAPVEPGSITLYNSLVRSARDTKYIGLFLSTLAKIPEYLSRSEKSLQLITLAHGLSMLAERDNNEQLRAKGVEAYRAGLRETAMALHDPQRATSDGMLAAVRLYRFYEIRYGAKGGGVLYPGPKQQVNSYKAHSDGEMAIFKAKGPCGYWGGPARNLLADGRVVSYIGCVGNRKHSFFSAQDWITIPWKNCFKTPFDVLTDVLVQIPGLLEDWDMIRDFSSGNPEKEVARGELLRDCLQLEESLIRWKDTAGDVFHLIDSAVVHRRNLPVVQSDEDVAVLHMCFLYWSSCIILYTTMYFAGLQPDLRVYSGLADVQVPFACPGYRHSEHPRNPTLYAHKVVNAIPLCHQPQCGGYAVLASTFPLGIALRYLMASEYFPHAGGEHLTMAAETAFMKEAMQQPCMASYASIFLANLEHVEATDPETDGPSGWERIKLQARRWWFGAGESNQATFGASSLS